MDTSEPLTRPRPEPIPFPNPTLPRPRRMVPVLRFQLPPTAHAVRRSMVLVIFLLFIIYRFVTKGWMFLVFSLFFLTDWGLWLTFAYFVGVIVNEGYLLRHPKIESFLFFLVTQQLVIAFIYWVVLAPYADLDTFERKVALIFPHVFPVISLLVDFFLWDVRIQEADFRTCFLVGVVYAGFNLAGRLLSGRSLYPLLNWTDWNSVLFLAAGVLYTYVFGHLVMWLQDLKWVHVEVEHEEGLEQPQPE